MAKLRIFQKGFAAHSWQHNGILFKHHKSLSSTPPAISQWIIVQPTSVHLPMVMREEEED